jgi:hypothetical protein
MLNQLEFFMVCTYFVNSIHWYLLVIFCFFSYLLHVSLYTHHPVSSFLIMIKWFCSLIFHWCWYGFAMTHCFYHIFFCMLYFLYGNFAITHSHLPFFLPCLLCQSADQTIWDLFQQRVSLVFCKLIIFIYLVFFL